MKPLIARQPIFDGNLKVYGYELLYRNSEKNYVNNINGDKATSSVVINSFINIGISKITDGKIAFVNFTERIINEEVATLFSNKLIAVEILEDIKITTSIVEKIKRLKNEGYMIVIDDLQMKRIYDYDEIMNFVDIIKVDFRLNTWREIAYIPKLFHDTNIIFLAEKIESLEEYTKAKGIGYSLFQGYFLKRPEMIYNNNKKSYKNSYIRLLKECNREVPEFNILAEIVRQDTILSYQLLKFNKNNNKDTIVKSDIIKETLVKMGLRKLRIWVYLLIRNNEVDDKPDELLKISLIRARFSETVACKLSGEIKASDAFMMGMLSLIDVLLDREIKDILGEIEIDKNVTDALLGKENNLYYLLEMIINYEKGNWDQVIKYSNENNINQDDLMYLYIEALSWTNNIVNEI